MPPSRFHSSRFSPFQPRLLPAVTSYSIDIDQDNVFRVSREDETGRKALFVTVQFQIHKLDADGKKGPLTTEVPEEFIVVKENGRVVDKRKITQPKTQLLTTVLALDISGSMKFDNKMEQAKGAALVFLDRLDTNANTGLVLFDHELRLKVSPAKEKSQYAAHREEVRQQVRAANRWAAPPTWTPLPRPCACSRTRRAAAPWS